MSYWGMQRPKQILDEAASHADNMLHPTDEGRAARANRAEYEAHLLKTLTVIGWALLESMPSRVAE